MPATKEDFLRHLTQLGFELGASREWVSKKFRRYLGEQRFAEFEKAGAGVNSAERSNRVYDFVQNLTEANLLRSMDPDVTADTSYRLYELCRPHLGAGKRVTELACWTGGLASFIASNHTDVAVAGVDRVEHIIALDRQEHQLPNLEFFCWDYRQPKPHALPPADVLLCGLGINNTPNGGYDVPHAGPMRKNSGYARHKGDVLPYFKHWRQAATDGATLFAVLRITTFGRYLAFLDAAQEAGWTALFDRCGTVDIQTAKEALPCLAFAAEPCRPVTEEAALREYLKLSIKGPLQLSGPMALAMYLQIEPRTVIYTVSFREKSVPTHDEIGIAGTFGYVFRHDAVPNYKLAIITVAEAYAQRQQLQNRNELNTLGSSLGPGSVMYVAPPPFEGLSCFHLPPPKPTDGGQK